jgi:hypothetical protein
VKIAVAYQDRTVRPDARWWSAIGIALIAAGVLLRAALYFPLAMFQIDSDAVLAGLCAFRVLAGEHPAFFPGGTRLGAASCYVAAGYFHLFGPGRVGLALTGLTWGALYLIFSLLLMQAVLGRKRGCLAFIFAVVPPEQFMTVTYAPWAYGEIMASCAATLWLATLWHRTGALWQRIAFGVSLGIGLWFSLQTLMIALPALAWIWLARRGRMLREAIPALAAALVGAAPFLAGNLTRGFPSLSHNWASRPTSSLTQSLQNFAWLASVLAPKLLFRSSGWWSETTLLGAAFAVTALGFALALRRARAKPPSEAGDARQVGMLLLLVVTSCVLIFSFSQAGENRGWTVRYIAPLYTVVPLFYGVGIAALWARSKALAVVTLGALLVPNLFLYGLPGSPLRARLTNELSSDLRAREVLAQLHVRMVYGDYFWVYHLSFDSRENILGIPWAPVVDYFDYADRLGTSSVRWALLGGLDEVRRWAKAADARGILIPDGDLWLFIAQQPAPNAAALIATLRKTGS